jgi:hypothetical protein
MLLDGPVMIDIGLLAAIVWLIMLAFRIVPLLWWKAAIATVEGYDGLDSDTRVVVSFYEGRLLVRASVEKYGTACWWNNPPGSKIKVFFRRADWKAPATYVVRLGGNYVRMRGNCCDKILWAFADIILPILMVSLMLVKLQIAIFGIG